MYLDLQVNGFAGVDFNDPATTADQVSQALAAMARTGVTRCLPTLITGSLDRFTRCARTLVRHPDPAILGLHMEGPYISPEDGFRGAHPREHVRSASIEDFDRRQDAADGRIRLLTLAPEVPGALPLIEHVVSRGVRVAIGHTNATGTQIRAAVRAGATLSTHLGNGIAPMLPRHPNPIWEQLAEDGLWASLIVDGHHLPAATVRAMVRAKRPVAHHPRDRRHRRGRMSARHLPSRGARGATRRDWTSGGAGRDDARRLRVDHGLRSDAGGRAHGAAAGGRAANGVGESGGLPRAVGRAEARHEVPARAGLSTPALRATRPRQRPRHSSGVDVRGVRATRRPTLARLLRQTCPAR